jgi:hypothetical protein
VTVSSAQVSATVSLRQAWDLRNAAAATLMKTEDQVRRLLEGASAEQIIEVLESFSPARSPGPEWTRSFDALIERLWAWCDAATIAAAETEFRARGSAWAPVTNALTRERGQEITAQLRRAPAGARLPAFTLG